MYSYRKNGGVPPKKLKKKHIEELHYICPIENLESILTDGILSHNRAPDRRTVDISDPSVQARRADVFVQRADENKGKLALHRHAVLYLNAHNAMMYVRKEQHENLCVLRIRREILDRGDAMLSSENASTDTVTFFPPTKNPLYLPCSTTHLVSPMSTEAIQNGHGKWVANPDRKQKRMAEALLPYQIHPSYIGGIFVSCDQSKETVLRQNNRGLPIKVHPSLFFQGEDQYIPLKSFKPLSLLSEEENGRLNNNLPDSDDDLPEYKHR